MNVEMIHVKCMRMGVLIPYSYDSYRCVQQSPVNSMLEEKRRND